MKNEELFNKTVNVLVKAYQEETLASANCTACAVGNLIAHNMGYNVVKQPAEARYAMLWEDQSYTQSLAWFRYLKQVSGDRYYTTPVNKSKAVVELSSTGYAIADLIQIERAFEDACCSVEYGEVAATNKQIQYAGLSAVYDVLLNIHEVDITTALTADVLFVDKSCPVEYELVEKENEEQRII